MQDGIVVEPPPLPPVEPCCARPPLPGERPEPPVEPDGSTFVPPRSLDFPPEDFHNLIYGVEWRKAAAARASMRRGHVGTLSVEREPQPRKGGGYDCDNLLDRISALKSMFFDDEEQKFRTVAIAILRDISGRIYTVVSVSRDRATPEQKLDVQSHGEIYVGGNKHAEMNIADWAAQHHAELICFETSKPVCLNCEEGLTDSDATANSTTTTPRSRQDLGTTRGQATRQRRLRRNPIQRRSKWVKTGCRTFTCPPEIKLHL